MMHNRPQMLEKFTTFPLASFGKTGWPWTEFPEPLPPTMPDGSPWPKISIVTPSYNQGQYIEETIRSVLLQGYPNLEYMIIDGGSTDNSVEIIKKYEPWLTYWVSEPDRGQSHAINKGFERCSGEIMAWINSDDYYMAGAFAKVAKSYLENPNTPVIVGSVANINWDSTTLSTQQPIYPYQTKVDLTLKDHSEWFLPQAAAFFPLFSLEKAGKWVREELHYTMDREIFYRLCKLGVPTIIPDTLATYRHHDNCKTTAFILDSYLENRRCFSYHKGGSMCEEIRRSSVLRSRIAQGYYASGKQHQNWIIGSTRILRAVFIKPQKFLNIKTAKTLIKKVLNIT